MQKITTFLMFNDQAEEAVNFYVSTIKNSRVISTIRTGDDGPATTGTVLGATFMLDGQEFLAYNGGPSFKFEQGMSLFVKCETQAEIDELWEKLSEGGEKEVCGWVRDRYGVSWQIVPASLMGMLEDPDLARSQRVMQAVWKMEKLDMRALEQAYQQ